MIWFDTVKVRIRTLVLVLSFTMLTSCGSGWVIAWYQYQLQLMDISRGLAKIQMIFSHIETLLPRIYDVTALLIKKDSLMTSIWSAQGQFVEHREDEIDEHQKTKIWSDPTTIGADSCGIGGADSTWDSIDCDSGCGPWTGDWVGCGSLWWIPDSVLSDFLGCH